MEISLGLNPMNLPNGALIICASQLNVVARFSKTDFLQFGKMSYGIYVLHLPVQQAWVPFRYTQEHGPA
jgi:peptidoglycan/LPS O-acetylase OafA/YrhL